MSKKETKTAQIIRILRVNPHDTDRVIASNIGCTPSLVAKVRRWPAARAELPRVETDAPAGVDVATLTHEMTKNKTDSNADLNPVNTAGVDPNAWTRTGILNQAEQYVTKDRAATHGDMENNFQTIADLWSNYLGISDDIELSPTDVAVMMTLLKIARIKSNPEHCDNWIDACGYLACGGELATQKDHK